MNPLYSIIIPALNQQESLALLLRSLEAQSFAPDKFECIVVDDGSTDGTGDFLERFKAGFEVRTVANGQSLGRARARDIGWRASRGEIVVFLDADMLPAPDWLEAFDQAFTGGSFDIVSGHRYHIEVAPEKELATQLGGLVGRDKEEFSALAPTESFQALEARARLGQYAHPVFEQLEEQLPALGEAYPESLINAYSFIASNVAVRRNILSRTSGFNLYLRKFDDIELGIRLWEFGARFGFAERARALHLNGQEPSSPWLDYAEGRALFCQHPYTLVALMNLWGGYLSPGGPTAPSSCFNSLPGLHRASRDDLPFDVQQEYLRLYRQPLPVDCRISKDELIKHYTSLSPPWKASAIDETLSWAVERGLFVGKKDSQVFFDFMHTGNWVRDCTPALQLWLCKYVLKGKKTRFQETQKQSELLSLHCLGKYEVVFPSAWFEGGGSQATLNIPLPTEHISQTGVKITRCFPENLLNYIDHSRGMVVGFPLARGDAEEVSIQYEFECVVNEFAPIEKPGASGETADMSRFLRVAMPPPYLAKAKSLLQRIIPEGTEDRISIARLIYSWIQHSVIFTETPFMYPYYLILDTGFGPCIQQTRLFINLCRMMKIPAREQCGALLPYDVWSNAPQRAETTVRGSTPFIHTWSEFYDPVRGWIPIEIHGFGAKNLTALNFPDAQLRDELDTIFQEIYKPYLFGSLHPFRVYTSEQANKAPVYPVFKARVGTMTQPEMQMEIATKLVSKLSCTLTQLN